MSLFVYIQDRLKMATASNRRNPPSKEHRCSICGRTFDSIETLNSHKRMEHSQKSQAPAGVG
jgi:ribosomal protein L34E